MTCPSPGDMWYPISALLKSPDMLPNPKQRLPDADNGDADDDIFRENGDRCHSTRARIDVVVERLICLHVATALAVAHHVRVFVHRIQRRIL